MPDDHAAPKPSASHTDDPLFIALCEAPRCWFAFDGPQRRLIEQDGGLSVDHVRRIGREFLVLRTMPGDSESVERIAEAVARAGEPEARTLDERAGHVQLAAGTLRKEDGFHAQPLSAPTKLLWFVAPTRWTPFDRLASAALGAGFTGARRMRDYYRRLDVAGFLPAAEAIDAAVVPVPGSRILDKLLMLRDPDFAAKLRPMSLAFQQILPPEIGSRLPEVADRLRHDPACAAFIGALPPKLPSSKAVR